MMKTIFTVFAAMFYAVGLVSAADLVDAGKQDTLQTLSKVAFMGKAVSNELNKISSNTTVPTELRQLARQALEHHDIAGTNSYEQLKVFIATWAITNEPPVSSDTIALMKRILEYGKSATVQLEAFSVNTNNPAPYRQAAGGTLSAIKGNDRQNGPTR